MLGIATLARKWNERSNEQKLLMVLNKLYNFGHRVHEKYHGFDFDGYITKENLPSDSATAYQGFSAFYLKILMREALSTGRSFDHFIDIGSGKGKVCFCASEYHRFKTITGIEFSPALVGIANANLLKMRHQNIKFIHADATEWKIPDGNSIIFLFNPFDGIVLKRFLEDNIDHFRKHNSVLVYANAVHRNVVQECGFTKVIDSKIYRSFIFHL